MGEPQTTERPANAGNWSKRFRSWLIPVTITVMATGLIVLISGNWTAWNGARVAQTTDDAYVRADLTPLSTKVAGLVASVEVADYQAVKAGDLLVLLQDQDFRAQVEQATAALQASESAVVNNQRQKDLQDARVLQSLTGISTAEAQIAAAEAGMDAAKSSEANARAALAATQADVQRTSLERKRQEALVATESSTRQTLEQAVAAAERYRGQQASAEAEVSAAAAQTASRLADLNRARAGLENSRVEVEVQRRQRAVLDSQELELRADVLAKRAAIDLARTNLNYTRIVAPEGGIVGERKVRAGQLVSPGTQVVTLVQQQVWVDANYKEDQLRNIREGDPAEIRVDAFPGMVVHGKVGKISPASGSQFALLPPDNATGNFTKIMQRVPVKILLDDPQGLMDKLRPGLSVVATIRTRAGV
ncbi:MAG TPA: HlyD family secretion protein [Bryobacteraceae bacterium]|nr:HlyD family secretion protein [Bryobacteraceae bacterium]